MYIDTEEAILWLQSVQRKLYAQSGVGSFLLPKVTVETPTISREFLIRRV
jgi:hypothetical protein